VTDYSGPQCRPLVYGLGSRDLFILALQATDGTNNCLANPY
jgi:hypothetical protein